MKRKTHIDILIKSAIMACLVIGYASCVDDDEVASLQNPEKSDVVTFSISTSNRWTPDVIGDSRTASSEERSNGKRTEALPMESDTNVPGEQIYMYMIEEDCPTVVDTTMVKSRANENSDYGIFAYLIPSDAVDTENPTYNPNATGISEFIPNSSLTIYNENKKYWPGKNSWLQFYAYYPYSETFVSSEDNQPKFSYTVESGNVDLMEGASNLLPGDNCEKVEIALSHILSQIQVKAGTLDEGIIKSISFKNIFNKGDKSFTDEEWTVSAQDKKDYTQSGGDTGFVIPFEGDKNVGEPFYLMPQTLSDDAIIEIVIEINSNPNDLKAKTGNGTRSYTLSKTLKDFTTIWSPDKKYTYVISTPEEVEVEVSDRVEGNVKDQLTIRNTGLSAAYIRAAIVGYWVLPGDQNDSYEDDRIVADWDIDDTEVGTIIWGSDNNGIEPTSTTVTGWYKHTDGYYYHLNPVPYGEETAKLFESYTLTGTSPVDGAVLDMTILVQAVLPADVTTAWPDEITNKFVTTAFVRE